MSVEKPVFKKSGDTDLYFLNAEVPPPGQVFYAAFLASAGSGYTEDLTVDDAWKDAGGIYLFLTTVPVDLNQFILKVRELVAGPGYYNTRWLWVLDPSFASSPWVGNRLRAVKKADTGEWSVVQTESFAFADYQLSVGATCTVDGPGESNGYGFTFNPAREGMNIFFNTPLTSYPMDSPALLLPLGGDGAGCFACSFKLPGIEEQKERRDFELLQLCCAYFVPEPDQALDGMVRTLKFPVLLQPDQKITLYGLFDPLNHLLGQRTSLSLFDPAGKGDIPGTMDSFFTTATGHGVSLKPAKGVNGEPDTRFVFAKRPLWQDQTAITSYYLTLEGAFEISTASGAAEPASPLEPAERIVCGISSAEYAGLMVKPGNLMHFIPGADAYAPGSPTDDGDEKETPPLLTGMGTTAWVYITPPDTGKRVYYYAQPEQSLIYDATNVVTGSEDSAGYLDFLEIPAAVFPEVLSPPGDEGKPHGFPMVPFRGISLEDMELCRRVELQAISPGRRAVIEKITGAGYGLDLVRGGAGDGKTTGVTPQGLVVELDDNLIDWKRLALGNIEQQPGDACGVQLAIDSGWLQFSGVKGKFRAALQSNQLFLVVAEPVEFLKACSVRFRLTEDSFIRLRRLPAAVRGPDEMLEDVAQKTREKFYPIYDDLTAYQSQLTSWAPGITPYLPAWEKEGAYFELFICGWKFLLSPYHWIDQTRKTHQNTIMILKFNHRTLDDLIKDTAAWPWPEAASIDGSLKNTQDELRSIFDAAKSAVESAAEKGTFSPYTNFVKNVITNPDWNGVLFLNCQVPLDSLPDQLLGISVGIDKKKFYAHHVGLNITPLSVAQQEVHLGTTSLFGLIDYQDPDDLMYSNNIDYDFKTLFLTILFENSGIKYFSNRIELLICKLFGDLVLMESGGHSNNLILDGVCQTDNGQNFYSFRQSGVNKYQLENSALETVEILSSSFTTLVPESEQESAGGDVHTDFSLAGNLYFQEFEGFDLFSFGPALQEEIPGPKIDGYLRYNGLSINMSFNIADPEQKKQFAFKASGVAFDLSQSLGRINALYKKFPLTLTGLIESPVTSVEEGEPKGVSPKEMNFAAVGTPLQPGALAYPWYGLAMDLDLGTLGSLAGNLGLRITLLAAWSPTEVGDEPIIYIGMKFPGFNDLGIKLPIEGVLSLGFRNIQFVASETAKGRLYMLRLRQFGIRLLGLSFPPGNNDIYLFGNPDNTSNTKLGWYAAYSDGKEDKEPEKLLLKQGRRNRRGGVS